MPRPARNSSLFKSASEPDLVALPTLRILSTSTGLPAGTSVQRTPCASSPHSAPSLRDLSSSSFIHRHESFGETSLVATSADLHALQRAPGDVLGSAEVWYSPRLHDVLRASNLDPFQTSATLHPSSSQPRRTSFDRIHESIASGAAPLLVRPRNPTLSSVNPFATQASVGPAPRDPADYSYIAPVEHVALGSGSHSTPLSSPSPAAPAPAPAPTSATVVEEASLVRTHPSSPSPTSAQDSGPILLLPKPLPRLDRRLSDLVGTQAARPCSAQQKPRALCCRGSFLPIPAVSYGVDANHELSAGTIPSNAVVDDRECGMDRLHGAEVPEGCQAGLPQMSDRNVANGLGGYAARRHRLECVEIDVDGRVHDRKLSRAEIMQAARETLPKNAPSPKAVARWLGTPEVESEELREFSARQWPGKDKSRKAMQKALRQYLRNSLQPRDIRQVDPAFSAKPALWVRHSALVVSLEGVRAIIMHDRVFLFDLGHPVSKTAMKYIQQSVTMSHEMMDDPDLPFEFKALEGIFIVGIMGLEQEFNQLNPEVERHLNELPTQLTSKMLEELRVNKQTLAHFLLRAHSVRDILEKLLDEDEDMANMYLTEKHRSPYVSRDVGEHDQVEMLLEAYMQVIDELVNRADLLNDAIDDTEDLVMIHLDTLRNKLLSVELGLSVVSMACGFGGLVSGVFGMNFPIPQFEPEASSMWFFGVVVGIIGVIFFVSWSTLGLLRRRGLYSI